MAGCRGGPIKYLSFTVDVCLSRVSGPYETSVPVCVNKKSGRLYRLRMDKIEVIDFESAEGVPVTSKTSGKV